MSFVASILVPHDFGEVSDRALSVALDLAQRFGSRLELLHTWEVPSYVYPGVAFRPQDFLQPVESVARDELDQVLARARAVVPNATATLEMGTPWRETLRVIEERGPSLVVMGTHARRGVRRAVLGSVAEKVVRTSPVPVLTVGRGAAEKKRAAFERILVATDLAEPGARATDFAVELAEELGASLVVLHVVEPPPQVYAGYAHDLAWPSADLERKARGAMEALAARVRGAGGDIEVVTVTGDPARSILRAAELRDVDLVVMGTHGRRGLARALLGSTAEKIVRSAEVPVLTVGGAGGADEDLQPNWTERRVKAGASSQ